jgi:hypothetical protein
MKRQRKQQQTTKRKNNPQKHQKTTKPATRNSGAALRANMRSIDADQSINMTSKTSSSRGSNF